MPSLIGRYVRWLHTRWPAGTVEKLPVVAEDGSTSVKGLYVVGDLTGIPLLKFSVDNGARAVETIAADPDFEARERGATKDGRAVRDLVVVGGGVSGFAAALEARKLGLDCALLEAAEAFSTIVNFPRAKPIYTYPTEMMPAGELRFTERSAIKEGLVEELLDQTVRQGVVPIAARAERVSRSGKFLEVVLQGQESLLAHRVIVGIGRSGNFRKLGVPGEDLDKVSNRLHDPKDYAGRNVLVVGGGDSALETAIAIGQCGGHVTLSYRKPEFSRPKPGNIAAIEALSRDPAADVTVEEPTSERVTTAAGRFLGRDRKAGSVNIMLGSKPDAIRATEVDITDAAGDQKTLPNDAVFSMIGREAPLGFFRRSGVAIAGEWSTSRWLGFAGFVGFCIWLYHWKSYGFTRGTLDPALLVGWLAGLSSTVGAWAQSPGNLLYTLADSMSKPSFYYTLAYCVCVIVFGIRRIRRRKTPYVTVQTLTLMSIQVLPLFLLPEIILPWLGRNHWFDGGPMGWLADQFFPGYGGSVVEREYWRAYGFVLAWPLMIYNIFTAQPLWGWIVLGSLQTFAIIPLLIWKWGKGVYCGWICSCGALAETLGDAQRAKMPHGPRWNRLNMVGQVVLAIAFALLGLRIAGWLAPVGSTFALRVETVFHVGITGYKWAVDTVLAGILGVGLYFHFSGRVWCRFACPLAALMHIYSRFSRFRILSEKKKCISCNVCTSVCHQGIDVMNFANKGVPMEDPECVRCSACVQSCPTGVLTFGEVDRATGATLRLDSLAASPVQMAEAGAKGAAAGDRRGTRAAARAAALVAGVVVAGSAGLLLAQALSGHPRAAAPDLSAQPQAAAGTQPTTRPAAGSATATRPAAGGAATRPAQQSTAASGEAATPAAQAAAVDHSAWDAMLRENVRDERVDYASIRDRHQVALKAYLAELAAVALEGLARDEQLAAYINLYNATMVQAVIDRRRDASFSPADDDYRVFKDPLVRLHDRTLSLDALEKQLLLPTFKEPRLHVALVCAAESCPPLIPRAYRADDLEAVLEANMRRFINDPKRNRIDPAARSMQLSQLFNWYAADFGGPEAVPGYVSRYYAGGDVRGFATSFVDYIWKLNATP